MGNRARGMGHGASVIGKRYEGMKSLLFHPRILSNYRTELAIINYQLPITNYPCPMPDARCPIPNYQFPITNFQRSIFNFQFQI
jgi:hypothetical protein